MNLEKDFYRKVEDVGYLNHVLYSDTDSIYIVIPTNVKDLAPKEKIKLAQKVSIDINKNIQEYLNNTYFKKSNINPKYNKTDFKTESILESIMFLPEVKKQYAYKMIAEGDRVFEEPEFDYKGIQVVRSDATELGKSLLREMIENVVLNSEIKKKDKLKEIINIVNYARDYFLEQIKEFKFDEITVSSKWGKDLTIINSMIIYNFITNSNIFLPASAGKFVYCKFGNLKLFETTKIDLKKINAISIPYRYSPEVLKEKFQEFQITIDVEKQWDRVFTTTVQRVVDLVKKEAKEEI